MEIIVRELNAYLQGFNDTLFVGHNIHSFKYFTEFASTKFLHQLVVILFSGNVIELVKSRYKMLLLCYVYTHPQ